MTLSIVSSRAVSITTGTSENARIWRRTSIAVDVRQADVQQHEVGVLLLDEVERRFAGVRADDVDLAPLQRESQADRLDDVGLVIDDQDLHQRRSSGGPSAGTTSVNVLPRPEAALDIDRAAVRLGDGQRDRQPKADASAAAAIVAPDEEPLEEPGLVLGGDPGPVVGDGQRTSPIPSRPRRSGHAPPSGRELVRVREEVQEGVLEASVVAEDRDGPVPWQRRAPGLTALVGRGRSMRDGGRRRARPRRTAAAGA